MSSNLPIKAEEYLRNLPDDESFLDIFRRAALSIELGPELESLLPQLPIEQLSFLVYRMLGMDKGEAKKASGWSGVFRGTPNRIVFERVQFLLTKITLKLALAIRQQMLPKALMIKYQMLDARSERVRDKAATDIIEWELGRATQRKEQVLNLVVSAYNDLAQKLSTIYGAAVDGEYTEFSPSVDDSDRGEEGDLGGDRLPADASPAESTREESQD